MDEVKEETDIYSDLPNFKYDEILDKLQTANKKLQARVLHLEEIVAKITKENEEYRSQCGLLSTNISSLFKTAQMEVRKKDNMIRDLNQRLICFKVDRYSRHQKKRHLGSGCQENGKKKEKQLTPSKSKKGVNSVVKDKNVNNNSTDGVSVEPKKSDKVTEKDNVPITKSTPLQNPIPNIKCHTLYSRRMFNKIYNIDQKKEQTTIEKKADKEVPSEEKKDEKSNKTSKNESSVIESKRTDQPSPLSSVEPGSAARSVATFPKPVLSSKPESGTNDLSNTVMNKDVKESHISTSNILTNTHSPTLKCSDLFNTKTGINPLRAENILGYAKVPAQHTNVSVLSCSSKPERGTNDLSTTVMNKDVKTSDISTSNILTNTHSQTLKCSELFNTEAGMKPIRAENISVYAKVSTQHINVKNNNEISTHTSLKSDNDLQESANNHLSDLRSQKVIGSSTIPSNQTLSLKEKLFSSIEIKKPENPRSHFLLSIDKLQKKSGKKTIAPISPGWNIAKLKSKNSDNETSKVTTIIEAAKVSTIIESAKVSSIEATKVSTSEHQEKEKSDLVEALFGSPVKWADNFMNEIQTEIKLTSPTAYEDSCSAQIENTRFKTNNENIQGIEKLQLDKTGINSSVGNSHQLLVDKNIKTVVNLSNISNNEKKMSSYSKTINISCKVDNYYENQMRPFQEVNSDKAANFTTFINHESFKNRDISSLSERETQNCLKSSPRNPKYQDSLLGQFDDTTQLISALARGPSKLSPINTPVKDKLELSPTKKEELSLEAVHKPLTIAPNKTDNKDSHLLKIVNTEINEDMISNLSPFKLSTNKDHVLSEKKSISPKPEVKGFLSSKLSPNKLREEKKTIFLDQPVNILCPRKTPRIVSRPLKPPISIPKNSISEIDKQEKLKNDESIKIKEIEKIKETDKETSSIKKRVNFGSPESSRVLNCKESILKPRKDSLTQIDKLNNVDMNRKYSLEKEDSKINGKTKKTFNMNFSEDYVYSNDRSRRENRKLEVKRSPSRKENSPRLKKDTSRYPSHIKNIKFKKPVPYKTSYRRPNCNFRHSSVERKVIKDRRQVIRLTPVREIPKKSTRSSNSQHISSNEMNKNDSKSIFSPRTHLIVRQSNSVWGSTTSDVVSAKSNEDITNVSSLKKKNDTHSSQETKCIKWVLTPIDIGPYSTVNKEVCNKSPSPFGESGRKTQSPRIVDKIRSPSIPREESFLNKRTPPPEPSPVPKSPGIVIISRKRPALFGVTEITDECSLKIKKEHN